MHRIVERITVDEDDLSYREHEARYRFALTHLEVGWTLDIASGTGYGAALLNEARLRVCAIELDETTVSAARRAFPRPSLHFIRADAERLPFPSESFTNIVTLETIEHLPDDRRFLSEITRILRPGGTCVLSTPIRSYSVRHGIANPFHLREYEPDEASALLAAHFHRVQLYYQGFSSAYRARVHDYAAAIQVRKQTLPSWMRAFIDHIYRPLRSLVPTRLVHVVIRRLLGLAYPQPATSEIAISRDPVEDASVLLAVCVKA